MCDKVVFAHPTQFRLVAEAEIQEMSRQRQWVEKHNRKKSTAESDALFVVSTGIQNLIYGNFALLKNTTISAYFDGLS